MPDSDHGDGHDQYSDELGAAYEEHKPRLRRRALRLANGNAQEADDLLQDTFLRALSYPNEPGVIINLLAYLLRVMHNSWRDKFKKAQKVRMESLDAIQSDPARQGELPRVEPELPRLAKNEDLLKVLRPTLGPLTAAEKFLLTSFLEENTLEQIAVLVGEDPRLTKVRWNALMAKLRARIKSRSAKTKGADRP